MIDISFDTSVIVDLARGRTQLSELRGRFFHPAISHVVYGELLLGARKSVRPGEKMKLFTALEEISILSADGNTSLIYSEIRQHLEQQGIPIPQNDLWIAAASIQAGVPLLTRDAHFQRIPQLRVVSY